MDEKRLAEIEAHFGDPDDDLFLLVGGHALVRELLAEVRRLQRQNDQAYSDGIDSGYADIIGIISEGRAEGRDGAAILVRIEAFLDADTTIEGPAVRPFSQLLPLLGPECEGLVR